MEQVKIKNFAEGDIVEGFYAVKDASLQTTTTGKNYIRITISDSSGVISGNMWDASKELFSTFRPGSIIKTRAVVESYRGKLQVKIDKLRLADSSEVDYSQFIPKTKFNIDSLWNELNGFIDTIADSEYKLMVEHIFSSNEVCEKFKMSPAAKSNHHAYIGGLLEHTVSLLRYAVAFATASPVGLDLDLLIAGTVLHDIGKIYELSVQAIIDYTDRGKLLGHLIIGSIMVEDAARELEGFPEEKKILLQHMILSHHGKYEYGSPVLPAIPEAFALHHIDNLDAKTVAACRIINEDESENSWTERSWMLDTTLYKKGQGSFININSERDGIGGRDSDDELEDDVAEIIVDEQVSESKPESGRLF